MSDDPRNLAELLGPGVAEAVAAFTATVAELADHRLVADEDAVAALKATDAGFAALGHLLGRDVTPEDLAEILAPNHKEM